jgi:hypothetical protein
MYILVGKNIPVQHLRQYQPNTSTRLVWTRDNNTLIPGLENLHRCSVCDSGSLHWKCLMRFINEIQWIHWKTPGTLKRCASFQSPGTVWKRQFPPCFWLARKFDWSKWTATSSLPPTCNPSFSLMVGLEKRLVTKKHLDVRETLLQGHRVSVWFRWALVYEHL